MIIIFDLDHTLFDAGKFKLNLAKTLGISAKKFNNNYSQYFVNTKTSYSLTRHLSILHSRKEIKDIKKISSNIKNLLNKMDNFLFPEAEDLLAKLAAKKHRLYLVTFGDKSWQRQKVKNLKIKKYFTKVFFTDKDKAEILIKFKNNKDIAVINDNSSETAKIKKILPQARIFLVKGPYANNARHSFSTVNLKQISKYL